MCVCVCVYKSLSHARLFVTKLTVARQAPLCIRILQARILEWVAMPSSGDLLNPGIKSRCPALQVDSLPSEPPENPIYIFIFIFIFIKWSEVKVRVTQSCLTLSDPKDYIVHGILQARILEWVAYPFSRGSSWPRNQSVHIYIYIYTHTHISKSLSSTSETNTGNRLCFNKIKKHRYFTNKVLITQSCHSNNLPFL